MVNEDSHPGADESQTPERTSWYVRIFPIRQTHRTFLGQRKRVLAGYGWSANGTPDGHRYDAGPYKSFDLAAAAARAELAKLGGSITGDIDTGDDSNATSTGT